MQLVVTCALHHDGTGQQAPGAKPGALVQAHHMVVGRGDREGQLLQPGHLCGLLDACRQELLADAAALRGRRHHHADQPGDDPLAFFNANTLAELHRLEGSGAP